MRKNFKNLIFPWVQCTSITKSCFQIIWPSHGLFQLYEIKLKKSHNFLSSVQKYHKSFSQLPWPFYGFLQFYEEKLQKSHISGSSVQKYHKSSSQLIWPFSGFLKLYEVKLQKSHISVTWVHNKSQFVLWAHLTVLLLIITVWGKFTKISCFREFSG